MCICYLYFTKNPNSNIKFIILFNREEFLKRAFESLGFHAISGQSQNSLLYPLDVPTQGTYLCLNTKNGNFSFLLNNPLTSNSYNINCRLKRGSLPLEFCQLDEQENNWNSFFEKLNQRKAEYNGFNIISGNFKTGVVKYYTNNSEDIKFGKEKEKEKFFNCVFNNKENNIDINCKNEKNVQDFFERKYFQDKDCDYDDNKDKNSNKISEGSNKNNLFDEKFIDDIVNPVSLKDFGNFDCNIPLDLKEDKVYVVSNNFIFDGDKRVDFGGKIFKQTLINNKNILLTNENSNKKKTPQINELLNENFENKKLINENTNDLKKNKEENFDKFIKNIFSDLLGNTEKLEKTHDEVVKILQTDNNWLLNPIVDDYVCSSLFIEDKIDDFYIEYGTRNSFAVIVDNDNSINVYNLDDKVLEEKDRLMNKKRDLHFDIDKMKFSL